MHESSLIKILSSLGKKEMTRFVEFSSSPYHNKNGELRTLVQLLSTIYPRFNEKNCDRKLIFAKIYPSKTFSQSKLDHLFNYSLELCEQFLTIEAFKEDKQFGIIYLLERLRHKNQKKRYERQMKALTKALDKQEDRSERYYYHKFLISTEQDKYYNSINSSEVDKSLDEKQYHFDRYFLAVKLKDACELVVRRQLLKLSEPMKMMREVIEHISTNLEDYSDDPPVVVYFLIYQMVNLNSTEHYRKLRISLKQNARFFSREELNLLYNYAQNFCIRKINQGEEPYLKELLQLYQELLNHEKLIFEGPKLSQWHYKNIVTVGLRLKEYQWTKEFIEEYKSYLDEEVAENAYRFNLASYYHATVDYEKAMELLVNVEYTNIRYNLDAKALLVRIYFDLDEQEALTSLFESFRKSINRNKLIADFRKTGYSKLIKYTQKAYKLKTSRSFTAGKQFQQKLDKLSAELEREKGVFNANWLKMKLQELSEELPKP